MNKEERSGWFMVLLPGGGTLPVLMSRSQVDRGTGFFAFGIYRPREKGSTPSRHRFSENKAKKGGDAPFFGLIGMQHVNRYGDAISPFAPLRV